MAPARALVWLLALAAAPATAQSIATSPGPDRVEVTLYRDPGRGLDQPMDLEWLEGFALISETRTVTLGAGESELRFEGVAGGILPQSAIMSGLPGIVERNRDAYLLSPATLVERSLGRRVQLRRTSLRTGEVREHQAVIRSGANGAVVLQTADGIEALRCTGLAETPIYDAVPEGLSAKPTLSVRVRSPRPLTATVTLSYLASGFDWQANYVAELLPDDSAVHLFAWLTLASMDETSFPNAHAQAVAGRPNRRNVDIDYPQAGPIRLNCWPSARTSDIAATQVRQRGVRSDDLINHLPAAFAEEGGETVYVTGAGITRQEEVGDYKLYRIMEPVTIASNSQKQVAFLDQRRVSVEAVYRQAVSIDRRPAIHSIDRFLVTRNRSEEGLGVPLPAGRIQLFDRTAGRPILVGQGWIADYAIGEGVEIELGTAGVIESRLDATEAGDGWNEYLLTLVNRLSTAVRYEAEIEVDEAVAFHPGRPLGRRDGRSLWAVTVPANGTASLGFRVIERDE